MNSVKKNFIYNSIFQIILLLIPLITTPYVSRVLGSENVGKYSFATAIATYFVVIATLGSTVYGQRLIAYEREDKKKLSQAFWEVFEFRFISTVCLCILYFAYLLIFSEINLLTIVVALNIVNVAVDITWFFQGIEEFKKTVFRSVVVKIISLVCIFLFVKSKNQTWLYALIFCGSLVGGNAVLWIPLRKYICAPSEFVPFKHIKGLFLVFLPTIASQVYTILDKSMIGWITKSDYYNGCYEQSERLARAALTMVTAVGAVVLPRVANLHNKGDDEGAKHYVYKAYRIVWALGIPIMVGLISISNVLVPLYLGDGYELSVILLQIFSLLVIFVSLAYVTGISYLTPTNQQNVYTFSVVVAAIVNFFMNLIILRTMGAVGAAIASVTAEGIGVAIQIGYCCYKKQLSLKSILGSAINYLTASIIMFLSIMLVKGFIGTGLKDLCLIVTVGILVYFIVLIIVRDSLVIRTLKSVILFLKRRDDQSLKE